MNQISERIIASVDSDVFDPLGRKGWWCGLAVREIYDFVWGQLHCFPPTSESKNHD